MRWITTCCACALALAGTDALAAEGKSALGPGLEPGQKPTGKVLKGEILRRCKTLDEEIQRLDNRLETLQMTMVVYSRQLDRLDSELDHAKAAMDDTDADDVERYNDLVRIQHEAIAKHDALLPEHNELVQRQNPRVDEFNEKCADVSYYIKEWVNTDVVLDPDLMPPATDF